MEPEIIRFLITFILEGAVLVAFIVWIVATVRIKNATETMVKSIDKLIDKQNEIADNLRRLLEKSEKPSQ
jgi:hypothetical protein